ncbi:hypothetical protein [Nocardia sp. NPDC057668]|uniref:DUF7373 family lipoprotein n=1 Tax=Nocardia sp. NPDC057668 TaxID=3346202 RepID=UPI00366D3D8C
MTGLDIGYYAIEPLTEPTEPDEARGRVVESVRMGEATIDPAAADPALAFGPTGGGAQPISAPSKTRGMLSTPVRDVLTKRGMLAGFSTVAMDSKGGAPVVGTGRLLTVILLRFPDSDAARQAADEMDAADAGVSTENAAVPIPGHPEAHAHWRPTVPTLAATMAQDSFVISLLVGHTGTDVNAMAALAGRAFEAQRTRLADFRPTPAGDIAALRADRDRMLSRLVADDPGNWPMPAVLQSGIGENAGWESVGQPNGVVYGPHAVQLRGPRPGTDRAEAMAFAGSSSLFRYATATVARRTYVENFRIDEGFQEVAAPQGVPEAKCIRNLASVDTSNNYSCWLLAGKYLALVHSRDESNARQKIAAQFVLLQRDPE